jgi:hypothetical protein
MKSFRDWRYIYTYRPVGRRRRYPVRMGVFLMSQTGNSIPAEGNGWGIVLVYMAVAVVLAAVFGPLAWLLGRDASRHGRNGWAWGLFFLWQPMVVGLVYLVIRGRPPRRNSESTVAPGWYPDGGGAVMRWWDGARWTEHILPSAPSDSVQYGNGPSRSARASAGPPLVYQESSRGNR